VKRRMLEMKRDGILRGRRRLHNEESKRMRWAGYVDHMR
jgi:hypothetical protein